MSPTRNDNTKIQKYRNQTEIKKFSNGTSTCRLYNVRVMLWFLRSFYQYYFDSKQFKGTST